MEQDASNQTVLKGVTAFVEVRSSSDNRSRAISRELLLLGATIDKKFSNDVTHVIYKEGTKRTVEKAQKKGLHLVSVLWVDSCKQKQEHVSEALFPATLPDRNVPMYLAKQKKPKCMQPGDFDEDLARISEKLNKRRIRNLMVEKWKAAGGTPNNSPGNILVEDTQPRTPGSGSSLFTSPIRLAIPDTPPSMKARLESLQKAKAKKAELSASKGDTEGNSPIRAPVLEPLQRRLFTSASPSSYPVEVCTPQEQKSSDLSSDIKPACILPYTSTPEIEKNIAQPNSEPTKAKLPKKRQITMKRLLSLKENSPQSFLVGSGETPNKALSCSPLFLKNCEPSKVNKKKPSLTNGKKRKVNSVFDDESDDESGSELNASVKPGKIQKCDKLANLYSPTPCQAIPQNLALDIYKSGPSIQRSRRQSVHSPYSEKEIQDSNAKNIVTTGRGRRRTMQNFDRDEDLASFRKKTDVIHEDEKLTVQSEFVSVSNESDISTNATFVSQAGMKATALSTSTIHGLSMSVAYGDSTLSSSLAGSILAPPRPSIDEFRLTKKRHKNRNVQCSESSSASFRELTAGNDSRYVEEDSGISSGTGVRNMNSQFRKPKTVKKVLIKQQRQWFISPSSSGTNSEEDKKNLTSNLNKALSPKIKKSIVMTSLHREEQEVVISVVKKLGDFFMTDLVGEHTSHVVCGDGRRTLNVLYAIARGCWLLSNTWVLRSLESGKWLEEELYELGEAFPAAKLSRIERQTTEGVYKKSFFSSVGLIYICKKTKPPREHLVSFVHLCGGQVTTCQRKADIIVGTDFHPDIVSVSPQWILDTLTQFKLQPFNTYMTSHPKKQSSPEF